MGNKSMKAIYIYTYIFGSQLKGAYAFSGLYFMKAKPSVTLFNFHNIIYSN